MEFDEHKLNELNQQLISAASKKNIVSAKSRADIDKEMSLRNFQTLSTHGRLQMKLLMHN